MGLLVHLSRMIPVLCPPPPPTPIPQQMGAWGVQCPQPTMALVSVLRMAKVSCGVDITAFLLLSVYER